MTVGYDVVCSIGLTAHQSRKQTRRVAADIEELESPLKTSPILSAAPRQLPVSPDDETPVFGVCRDSDAMSCTQDEPRCERDMTLYDT